VGREHEGILSRAAGGVGKKTEEDLRGETFTRGRKHDDKLGKRQKKEIGAHYLRRSRQESWGRAREKRLEEEEGEKKILKLSGNLKNKIRSA